MATTKTVRVEITGDPSDFNRSMTVVSESANKAASATTDHFEKATSRVGGFFHQLDAQLGDFGIPFTGVLGSLGNQFEKMAAEGETKFARLANAGKMAAIAVGVAFAAVAVESIHLADAYENAHALLETSVKNTGVSMEKVQPAVNSLTNKFARFGYNATEVEKALARGTLGTGNVVKAYALMNQAADLAAFKHIDLEAAMTAVTKASEGQLRPLKMLGIDLPIQGANSVAVAKAQDQLAAAVKAGGLVEEKVHDGRLKGAAATDALRSAYDKIAAAQQNLNDKTNSGEQILKALHEKTMGAAEKQSKTFEGSVKALRAQMENLGIKIGIVLIPIITTLTTAISDAIQWFEKHKEVAEALGIVIGGALVVAIGAYIVAMMQAAVATIAATWPILAVIAACAAIVAAIVLVWTHWDQIWNWIKDHPAYAAIIAILAAPIAMFVLIVGALKTLWENWDEIWGWIKQAASDAADWIVGAFNDVIGFFESLPGRIFGAIVGLPGVILGLFSAAMSGAWGAVTSAGGAIVDWFTGLPGRIVRAVGDLGSVLWDAGAAVLQGLINGAESKLNDVKDFFTGIAGDLTDWKGPPEKDARLLIPAGQVIMESLIAGSASRLGDVEKFFSGVAPKISGTMNVAAVGAGSGGLVPTSSGSSSSSASPVFNITVNAGMGADGQQIASVLLEQFKILQNRGGLVPWVKA